MSGTNQIRAKKQLLVEGNDQRNFFEAMINHLDIEGIQVHNFGGIGELSEFLDLFVKLAGFDSIDTLGIVRDAEVSAHSALQSVQSSISRVGLTVPVSAGCLYGAEPSVAIMILPDNSNPGMLETNLCWTFRNTGLDSCIDSFFACAEAEADVSIVRPEKARAHAWLSTQDRPHLSVGVAAKAHYWDLNHAALAEIRSFLMAL